MKQKRWFTVLLLMFLLLISVPVMAAEADNTIETEEQGNEPGTIPLESITVEPAATTLVKGQSAALKVTFQPQDTSEDKTVAWTSSDASVASVKDGFVTANKAGKAVITASCGDKSAQCVVTVKEKPLKKITLSKSSLTLLKGKKATLKVSYSPADTTDSKTIKWSSSKPGVAAVKNGKITAKKAGETTITAKCGSRKAVCKVTVKEIHLRKISLNKKSAVLDKGTENAIKVKYTPANTTDSRKVRWTSSNKKVAIVKNGKILAKNYGTATLTANCGGKKASCKITIKYGYENVDQAYSRLNKFRTGGKVFCWNMDNKTKTWFNTGKSNKLSALKRDKELEKTARIRAKDLIRNFSHSRPNGDICFSVYPDDLLGAGENIAYGYSSAEKVTNAWKESNEKFAGQGHRRNMLNPGFNAVGIACYQYKGRKYWVQSFGYRY